MGKEGGGTAAGWSSCPGSAGVPALQLSGGGSAERCRVVRALPWVGERPVPLWGVLSSEILV